MPDYWIQLENKPWDTMPNNRDRLTDRTAAQITSKPPENIVLVSPGSGVATTRTMFAPLRDSSGKVMDALIFRRYKAPLQQDESDAWTVPDDRKVNPWDLNEPNPTDSGTMGTIPGPVIECVVGDSVTVHFRNLDMRATKSKTARAHSIHIHGFVFKPTSDGAYPLSPPDQTQPISDSEKPAWEELGVKKFKMGDRVPVGGTYIYKFETVGWPTTAGVWLYHDHSICDMENINLGAIGIVVIHNPADANDFVVGTTDLPDENFNGSPVKIVCDEISDKIMLAPSFLSQVGVDKSFHDLIPHTHGETHQSSGPEALVPDPPVRKGKFAPNITRVIQQNDILVHLSADLTSIIGFCTKVYQPTLPQNAQYLQLFHFLTGAPGQCINGRTYLGNTPTMIAGTKTKMRFGVVGMGSEFHTFHIHGHRWIVPGPDGLTPNAIKNNPQRQPVSQFEDTRTFGPANSFVFTIEGEPPSFMRAGGSALDLSKGEWHMHCHVLGHMMMGMMGSLLIVDGGTFAGKLPVGVLCDDAEVAPSNTVVVKDFSFTPPNLLVPSGTIVTFDFRDAGHTVTTSVGNQNIGAINAIEINNGKGPKDPILLQTKKMVTVTGGMGDSIKYECGIHGPSMNGSITISM